MLSQEKIEKLQPFVEHKTFGLLLKDAVEKWQKYNPVRCESGLTILDGKYINRNTNKKDSCCLIGSALIDKIAITYTHYGDTAVHYNLIDHQVDLLVSGFDSASVVNRKCHTEEFLFGFDVAKIIFE